MIASVEVAFQKQKLLAEKLRTAPISERKRKLRAIKTWIIDHQDDIRRAVHADFSKPHQEIDSTDIYPVLAEINHTLAHLDDWVKPKKVDTPLTLIGSSGEIRFEPRGVCLLIAPWNFPFNLSVGPLIPCLAAGNTAIIKPSEITPSTSALVSTMMAELFPDGEVAVFQGGPEVSTSLLNLPFDHIFFTGSPAIGKIVMRAAAEHLTSVTLELGGKSPAVIHSDVRLDDAVRRIVFSKFLNNGQTCIAPDYLLVHESIVEDLLSRLRTETLKRFSDQSSIETSPSYGRISSSKHFDRLKSMLDEALTKGWKSVLDGPLNSETRFFHPCIITGGASHARVMDEEIFGPILPVITYRNEEEVVRIINSKPKPLALYVFSGSNKFADRIISSCSSGTACHNDCMIQFVHSNLPFGGVNNSGEGKSHGFFGFRAFSNEKSFVRQRSGFITPYLFQPPYKGWFGTMMQVLFRWF